jgi:hypothetical protein
MIKIVALLVVFSQMAWGQVDEERRIQLWTAVSSENPEKVKAAFQNLEDFWAVAPSGVMVLEHAVHIGNVAIIETLLRRMGELFGSDNLRLYVNPRGPTDTRSALYSAFVLNRPAILSALLAAGADINYVFNVGTRGDFRLRDLFGGVRTPEMESIFAQYQENRSRRPREQSPLLSPEPVILGDSPLEANVLREQSSSLLPDPLMQENLLLGPAVPQVLITYQLRVPRMLQQQNRQQTQRASFSRAMFGTKRAPFNHN